DAGPFKPLSARDAEHQRIRPGARLGCCNSQRKQNANRGGASQRPPTQHAILRTQLVERGETEKNCSLKYAGLYKNHGRRFDDGVRPWFGTTAPKNRPCDAPALVPQPRKASVGVVKFVRFGNIAGKSLSATPNHFARVA